MGGSKDAPDPPPAPDPIAIAQADARFNRIDQTTPFGSLTFSGPDRNQATQTFSPEVQRLFEQQLGVSGNALAAALQRQGLLDTGLPDFSGLPERVGDVDLETPGVNLRGTENIPIPGLDLQSEIDFSRIDPVSGIDDFAQQRNDVEEAQFERIQGLLRPEQQRRRQGLESNLANRGLQAGTEGFGRETGIFNENIRESDLQSALASVLAGGQEQSRLLGESRLSRGQQLGDQLTQLGLTNQERLGEFGAGLQGRQQQIGDVLRGNQNELALFGIGQQGIQNQFQGANLANAARDAGINEQLLQRGVPFNEIQALLGQQQVGTPQLNSFFGPGQADVTGGFALQQNALQNAFNAENQRNQGLLGGLFGLGGAALGNPALNIPGFGG